ncbi:hypothetical protein Tco_0680009 [Tanacetum coccineum]|uniref:Uncharacterized protein n=1 Tax=Tanacetum coccineum TaxID=301880 RepID=A0ABQ4XJD6_9ASTR
MWQLGQAHSALTNETLILKPNKAPSTENRGVSAISVSIEGNPYCGSLRLRAINTKVITSSHPQLHENFPPSPDRPPLSPDHPLTQAIPTRVSFHYRSARMVVRTQPTLSTGISSYETPSPSSSLTHPIRKRYRGTSELVEDTEDESSDSDTKRDGSEDEGHGLEDEDPGSEEEEEKSSRSMSEQQRVEETPTPRPRVRITWVDPIDGKIYTDIPVDLPPARVPVQTPPSPDWSFGSLPVSPLSPAVPTPVASPVTTLAATIAVDEDEFLEVGAQLELHGSILHDHMQRLDALPPTLFEGYDRDLRELYTRSGAVRDEIFSQRYRLRCLEQEQKRATVTFGALWRPMLALDS